MELVKINQLFDDILIIWPAPVCGNPITKIKSYLPKDAEANFAVAVEVGVETNSVVAGSD